jgi:hypothetical protein
MEQVTQGAIKKASTACVLSNEITLMEVSRDFRAIPNIAGIAGCFLIAGPANPVGCPAWKNHGNCHCLVLLCKDATDLLFNFYKRPIKK